MTKLTVADGLGDVADVVGAIRQHAVVGGDDHVVLMWEAGDGGQHVAVEPRFSGHSQKRDTDTTSFRCLVQRPVRADRNARCEDHRDDCSVRPTIAVCRTIPSSVLAKFSLISRHYLLQ